MGKKVLTGLAVLKADKNLQQEFKGNVAYLCHSASVDENYQLGIFTFQEIFKERFTKIFSPQHGLVSDVQDNMVESNHYDHPFFKLPVYSLYSETREPTDEMLAGIDHIFVDLQDVGTRIYTYIYTMTLLMEACAEKGIEVIVLDRPNPINGMDIEGNVLDLNFKSFVGLHELPVRHGLTIAEVALMAKKFWGIDGNLRIVKMEGWERDMNFEETNLPWVLPSPNLATVEAAFPFVGTVIFEGTNISEGRGTTRSLEIVGHPGIEPFSFHEKLKTIFNKQRLEGFALRPIIFQPTFQKHQGKSCGGYQIHVTDRKKFKPWRISQLLCREFYHALGADFKWKQPPYEYVHDQMPIDVINGTDKIRLWVESNGDYETLESFEKERMGEYIEKRDEVLLY